MLIKNLLNKERKNKTNKKKSMNKLHLPPCHSNLINNIHFINKNTNNIQFLSKFSKSHSPNDPTRCYELLYLHSFGTHCLVMRTNIYRSCRSGIRASRGTSRIHRSARLHLRGPRTGSKTSRRTAHHTLHTRVPRLSHSTLRCHSGTGA